MRALVVDDEPLARQALARILTQRADVESIDFAEDGSEALALLRSSGCDLLLLDIHMPELSGLQLIERLAETGELVPAVVFITAFHEHAVEAFEKKAVDYVLKPFSAARVHQALDSAVRHRDQERIAELLETLRNLPARHAPGSGRIALRDKGRVVFVDVLDLVSAESEGNYVLLRTQQNTRHLLRDTLAGMETKLAPYGFIRIHRSTLVNSAYVDQIEALPSGDFRLRTTLGCEFNVTRTYRANLRGLAQFWLGAESIVST